MRLITSYFEPSNEARRKEIDFCLWQNISNPLITEIIVLDESGTLKSKGKLTAIPHDRPTYQDHINHMVDNRINIISNADIYFDGSLKKLNQMPAGKICYAITRTEKGKDGKLIAFENHHYKCPPHYSQDVWIFNGKHKITGFDKVIAHNNHSRGFDVIPFYMGIGGCDNVFAALLRELGYDLRNPYKEIICIHEHADMSRPHYTHRITGTHSTWGKIGKGRVENYGL